MSPVDKPERDPALYVGTRLAVELINTATFDNSRVRELADGERPRRDDIIEAAHGRLTKEMEQVKARRKRSAEFREKHGREEPEADDGDSD
jgi:hypothetical protein